MASLYGIRKSNRDNDSHWGKNCFNSSFPTSLLCWMRDNNKNPKWICLDKNLTIKVDEISVDEVFGTSTLNEDLTFSFEATFPKYDEYAYDALTGIDLVVCENGEPVQPLEMKLTVVPDNTTASNPENEWAPELVIRPASTQFCALGMIHATKDELNTIRELFDPVCSTIQHWDSKLEIAARLDDLLRCLDRFQENFYQSQRPFLVNPIWKTQGKSAALADPAFDILVWSDHALCRSFIARAKNNSGEAITRPVRAAVRLARVLWEISRGRKTRLSDIYTQMAFDLQTDKEFSMSGTLTSSIVQAEEYHQPRSSKSVLTEIILDGGEKKLSPERRFDASIYFTASHLFEK